MPRGRVSQTFLSSETAAAAGYLGLLGTVLPSVVALIQSLRGGSTGQATAWLLYLVVIGLWFARVLMRKTRTPWIASTQFKPFAAVAELRVWPRDAEVTAIAELLTDKQAAFIPIIVGPSGAGKSTILRKLLPSYLDLASDEYIYIDQYADIEGHSTVLESATSLKKGGIVVLDQYEQLVATISAESAAQQELSWARIGAAINQLRAAGIHVLISIRHEWFYRLRPLGALVPAPIDTVRVIGPRAEDQHNPTLRAFRAQLRSVLGDSRGIADDVLIALADGGTILLLEAQIVGATLESLRATGASVDNTIFTTEIGGVAGAIDVYFDEVLAAAPDRRIGLKVLVALSTSSQFREQHDLARIYDALFEKDQDVGEAIDYLVSTGLLLNRGDWGQLELAHDYVAEYFYRRSGYELRPTDRDNVVYHLQSGSENLGPLVKSRRERNRSHGTFGWAVLAFLAALMTARLVGFGLPWTRAGSLEPQYTVANSYLDATYVPIYLCHGAWATYICLFYIRILDKLAEPPLPRLVSLSVPIFMASCVTAAVFVPYVWVASVGLGGLYFAIKLISLGLSASVGAGARARMLEFGRTSGAALAFCAALGIGAAWACFQFDDVVGFQARWTILSILVSITMTLPAIALAPYHIQGPAVPEFLGLLGRSPRGAVARVELQGSV